MRIEPKQAFYNEDTGAVQPWKDIEVTDAVGNELVAEGLVTEIEGGGGGGGETITWLLKDATATVAYDSEKEEYGAKFLLPASVTADNFESTFSGKSSVIELNGDKVESPIKYDSEGTPPAATIYYWEVRYGEISSVQAVPSELYLFFYSDNDHVGQTFTLSLGIVEE